MYTMSSPVVNQNQKGNEQQGKRALKDINGIQVQSPPSKKTSSKKKVSVSVVSTRLAGTLPATVVTTLPMKVIIDKIKSADKKEMVIFLKKVVLEFPHVIGTIFDPEEYPGTVVKYNLTTKKNEQKKTLTDAFKQIVANDNDPEETLVGMICSSCDYEPAIIQRGKLMDTAFMPKKYPHRFEKEHPMLSRCFMCATQEDEEGSLKKIHDLKACTNCLGTTYTKSELNSTFSLSSNDTNTITSTTKTHGHYNSIIYIFRFKDAAQACYQKFGCLSNFVREKKSYSHTDIL
mmetsp:Transcript_16626/g.18612  ORF Transcript_16626/g.18612 Transcript_16626/m.18612 type:complete len:289 (+) Transcript_16626:96-962(+)